MNSNLYKTLVDRKLINKDIVVTASVNARAFTTGTFTTTKEIMWDPRMQADHVHAIEGMDPERFAKSCNIKADGSVREYKKRGRKAKQLA